MIVAIFFDPQLGYKFLFFNVWIVKQKMQTTCFLLTLGLDFVFYICQKNKLINMFSMFQPFCRHHFFSFVGFLNMEEIVNKNNNPQRCIWCSFYLWRKRAKELSGYNPMFGNSDTWQARSIQIYSWCIQWSCNPQIYLAHSDISWEQLPISGDFKHPFPSRPERKSYSQGNLWVSKFVKCTAYPAVYRMETYVVGIVTTLDNVNLQSPRCVVFL